MATALGIKGVNHLGLLSRHVAESAAFYRDVLGFRPVKRPDFDFNGAWLYNYGLVIHIIENDNAPTPGGEIETRCNHLALHVDDLDAAEAELTKRGISYRRNEVAKTGIGQIFFHDPDGHHVEIAQYPPIPPFLDE